MKSASFWRSARLGPALVYVGVTLIWCEALLVDASHGIFKSEAFAERAAASLGDPRVSGYVAEKLTDAIVEQRPNLIALRPLIVATMGGLVQSQPFRAVARRALATAQASLFSEEGKQVLLSVPDVGILLRSALAGANPELAAKIPDRLDSTVGRLEKSRAGQILARAHTVWGRVKWLTRVLLFVGPLLVLTGIGLHRDRRRGLVRAGIALIVTGLFIALLVPFGRLVALWLVPHDPAARAAVFGVWRAYFLGLFAWASTLAGAGLVLAAAGTSLYEVVDPFTRIRSLTRAAMNPPTSRGGRGALGSGDGPGRNRPSVVAYGAAHCRRRAWWAAADLHRVARVLPPRDRAGSRDQGRSRNFVRQWPPSGVHPGARGGHHRGDPLLATPDQSGLRHQHRQLQWLTPLV